MARFCGSGSSAGHGVPTSWMGCVVISRLSMMQEFAGHRLAVCLLKDSIHGLYRQTH